MSNRKMSTLYRLLAALMIIAIFATACAAPNEPKAPQAEPTTAAAPTDAAPVEEVPAEPTATMAAEEAPAEPTATTEGDAEAPSDEPRIAELKDYSPDLAVPDEEIVVTFSSWVGGGEAYQLLAQKFNEIYPNITIEFQDVPFEEIRTKLLTQVAANNPPDVAYLSSGDVPEFAKRNGLVALDNFIDMSQAVSRDDYVEPFLQATIYDGKVYGLPITAETTGLFYRTDLFEAAGLDPNQPPKTWAEFEEYAQKLTIPEKKQYGTIVFAPEAAYYWYPWLWQAGGELISEDGKDVLWDSEAGKKAAEFYVNMKNYSPPDFLNSNSWDGRVAFANGTVAMYVAGAWFAGTLQSEFPDINDKWATAPLPEDERCATTIAGDALVVFQGSKNPEAAWKWIEFLSAPENLALINLGTPDAPTTLLPPRTTLLEDPQTYAANPVLQGFADNMQCAVVFSTQQERWGEMETILNEALGAAFYGEMDATTAVEQSAMEAEAIANE